MIVSDLDSTTTGHGGTFTVKVDIYPKLDMSDVV